MIQSIINELKESEEILEHYDLSGHLHYALISSGSYRTYQRGRINFLIFNEKGNPLFFLKFYKDKQMNKLIEHEFEKQLFLCTTYKNPKIPKPLALFNINGFSIMVEEAFSGKTLSRLLSENPSIESVIEVIDFGKKVQDDLNDNLLLSSFSEFEHELNDLIPTFTSIYNPTPFEDFLIKKYTDVFIEQFKHKQIYKRFTNGDFVPKNVILSSDCLPVLIDFEFVEETHLYFLDWFRFFTHYFNVPPEIIQHILEHKFDDYSLNAALFRFRDPKELVNNTTIGAMWLVFHIKDFVTKSYVMPGLQLKKEREHLRSMLTSLLSSVFSHDQEIIDLIRDDHIKGLEAGLQEREQRINELDVAVQAKDAQISDFEGQITDISGQLTEKDKQLDALNVTVQAKDAQISDSEGQITDFSEQVKEKDKQLDDLNGAAQAKNEQISDFEGQIADISDQLNEREQQINELNGAVQDKDARILNLERQITNISGQLKDKGERIREIVIENVRNSSELNTIKSSVTWRTVMKWHSFIEKVMQQETNRRSRYDLGIIGLRTIANEGWGSFWWKYKQHIRQTKHLPKRKIKIDRINLPKEEYKDLNKILDVKVSVVIPTKNAGYDFVYVLDKLTNQEGLKELEIVAVDSGSTDDTIEIAKKYGVKVYQIKPDEFGHGKTRNLGAEKATGEFLLLTTQDAIPASTYLVYKMVNILKEDTKIAAVTCRQIPRSDADLMACFQVWSHYHKFLYIREDKVTSVKNMATITPLQKRKMANLSDSCCCIRRDLFSQYRFKTEFAEDLDLGIRFLDDGYKLAFLHSGAIIHSHNRIPAYFFKVSYTDSKVVSRIVGNVPLRWNTKDIRVFYACIKELYKKMIWAISIIEKESKNEIDGIFTMLKESLNSDLAVEKSEDYTGELSLDKLFNEIESIIDYYEKEQVEKTVYNILLSAYLETLSTFNEYAMSYPSVFSIKKDFISTLYKLFANSSGAALGNFILFLYEKDITTQEIEALDKNLSGGV